MGPLSPTDIALRLAIATLIGAVLGIDRQARHKAAGLRTMMLVAIGSASFVIGADAAASSIIARFSAPEGAEAAAQSELYSRIMQGIIGGVGFLGAGAIIQSRGQVRGVTTAATIWVVCAVGIAAGMGAFWLAIITGVFAAFTLTVVGLIGSLLFPATFGGVDGDEAKDDHMTGTKE